MKRINLALLIALLIVSCASKPAVNPDEVSLNTAIRQAAARMETRLGAGTKVALVNFTSPSQAFSEYVLDELSSVLVNDGILTVVDRANLDRIRQELGFNSSGEVSEKSMQEIGQMLGAQALVTGSLTSIAELRRVMFKVIITETAAVAVQHPADIINDRRVQALLASDAKASGGGGSQGVNYGAASAGNNKSGAASGGRAAAPAQASRPANGIYTYWPRLRATKAGLPADNVFIAQITVAGGYMTIHFARTARGAWNSSAEWDYAPSGFYYKENFTLQDLDNPSRSYNPVSDQSTSNGMGRIWSISFNQINSKRFRLTFQLYSGDNPPYIIDEIILGEPDQ